MNNTLKNVRNIINIVLGAFIFIVSIVYFIDSKEVWADEYGTDISFNNDYVIAMMVGVIILIHGIVELLYSNPFTTVVCNITAFGVIGFYSLGVFFKPMMKALSKHVAFVFGDYKHYLFIGIVGVLLLAYYVVRYFELRKTYNK